MLRRVSLCRTAAVRDDLTIIHQQVVSLWVTSALLFCSCAACRCLSSNWHTWRKQVARYNPYDVLHGTETIYIGVGGCLGEWVLTAGISRASLNRLKVRRSSARRLLFPWESACVLNTCQIQSRMSVHALHVIICNIGHFLLSPLPLNANLATATRAHTHPQLPRELHVCLKLFGVARLF